MQIGSDGKHNTRWFDLDGTRAIVALTKDGNPIITGYEIRADESTAAYPAASDRLSRPLARKDEIIAALKSKLASLSTPFSIAYSPAQVNAENAQNQIASSGASSGVWGNAPFVAPAAETPTQRAARRHSVFGTVNALRDHIESNGGKVVAVSALTLSRASSILSPRKETIDEIKRKWPDANRLLRSAGIAERVEALTESQCRYLLQFSADGFRNRIAEAIEQGIARTQHEALGAPPSEGVARTAWPVAPAAETPAQRAAQRHSVFGGVKAAPAVKQLDSLATAIVALTKDGNPIITGYEIRADESTAAYPAASDRLSRPLARKDEIVDALKSKLALLPTPPSIPYPAAQVNAQYAQNQIASSGVRGNAPVAPAGETPAQCAAVFRSPFEAAGRRFPKKESGFPMAA